MVSHAARVGAMTMTRPVGGSRGDKSVVVGRQITVLNGTEHNRSWRKNAA